MYGFSVLTLPPLTVLAADMYTIGQDLQDFTEPLTRAVHEVASPAIGRNFDEEGPGWAPLSEITVAIRGESGPILDYTGQLREGATDPENWEITEDAATFDPNHMGMSVDYGMFHITGTQFMPERSFLQFDVGDVDAIAEIFAEWMGDTADAGGF